MARIHELLRQLRLTNAALADDIEREVDVLGARRAFGLNFERHTPEAVELPGRPVRTGDKVHVLPPRGEKPKAANSKLWRVVSIQGEPDSRVAILEPHPRADPTEPVAVAIADLVVVAEFRDPIYPGLVSTGRVERGGDKPFHTVINGENYHALQTLLFTHRGKVDAIYIDPPYNTGAKDWKYNNDYVESDDLYRHSKWLAFMERRLLLAKELLNPDDSVLVVTIDEKEHLRLGLLLEQVFPDATSDMITSVVNPRGRYRPGGFARSDEYVFFLRFGQAPVGTEDDPDFSSGEGVPWRTLRRSDASSARGTSKGGPAQFYPIYVSGEGQVVDIGPALPRGVPRDRVPTREGCISVFPIRENGLEMNWGLTAPALRKILERGYVRVGRFSPERPQLYEISYLTSGKIEDVTSGRATVTGHNPDGSVIATYSENKKKAPTTTWVRASHNAETNGTAIVGALIPGRAFPFPKSLYAVEDALRFFIDGKPDAVVVDFFSGSGTTAHAVMRLNKQDGGRRISISVTNNEVSAEEQTGLRSEGLRPGDPGWEEWGICEYVTKSRIRASITGMTPSGDAIKGDYKFTDEFPMADGFEENVEFLTLTYEAPLRLRANRDFERISPLLWLRAGSRGRRIESLQNGWDVTEAYGVIADLDKTDEFFRALAAVPTATTAIVITDDDGLFESVVAGLAKGVEPVRLYDAYLRNFEIDAMRGTR